MCECVREEEKKKKDTDRTNHFNERLLPFEAELFLHFYPCELFGFRNGMRCGVVPHHTPFPSLCTVNWEERM